MSDVCAQLHKKVCELPRFTFPFVASELPKNGIYFLFEKGEQTHGGERIVRVGTHTGKDQLRSRLLQHFVQENKDRSIFRKNIGRALLNKMNDPYLVEWEIDRTAATARSKFDTNNAARQKEIEQEVSEYIQRTMSFAVIEIDNATERLSLESKLISTLSHCDECKGSKDWLGNFSPKEKIRASGLWLVNELYKTACTKAEIEKLFS